MLSLFFSLLFFFVASFSSSRLREWVAPWSNRTPRHQRAISCRSPRPRGLLRKNLRARDRGARLQAAEPLLLLPRRRHRPRRREAPQGALPDAPRVRRPRHVAQHHVRRVTGGARDMEFQFENDVLVTSADSILHKTARAPDAPRARVAGRRAARPPARRSPLVARRPLVPFAVRASRLVRRSFAYERVRRAAHRPPCGSR